MVYWEEKRAETIKESKALKQTNAMKNFQHINKKDQTYTFLISIARC